MNRQHIIYIIIFVGIVIWQVVESQNCRRQGQEIIALQQQLRQITEVIREENGKMSNLVAQARQSQILQTQRADQANELVQLRGEVSVLRQQTNEIEALRGEIYQVRMAFEGSANAQNLSQTATAKKRATSASTRLQILAAYYWTPNRAIDVTGQLNDQIVGDKLEVIAGNNLRGDPEYGQTKTLTVLYNFDGVTRTNQVREGELLMLPEQ